MKVGKARLISEDGDSVDFRLTDMSTEYGCNMIPKITISGYQLLPEDKMKTTAANNAMLAVKRVIYHDPATIVFWKDGSKTVVKCHDGDTFDQQTGFLLAVCKKAFGNKWDYMDKVRKYTARKGDKE